MSASAPASVANEAPLRGNVIAGVSIAGLLLAEAVAYSGVAGLPPQAGVVGLICGLVVYGLAGASRSAIVAATSSSAAVLAASIGSLMLGVDPAQRVALSAGLVLAAGALFIVGALARLGGITQFIAKPVLRGFAFGLACVITLRQFAKMAGVTPHGHDALIEVFDLLAHWREFNLYGLALGAATFALLRVCARWRLMPGALVAMVLGILVASLGSFAQWQVQTVGAIELTLAWPRLPDLNKGEWLRLGELSLALALILFAESSGAIRTLALKHGDPVIPNRELFAIGVANIASGFLHGTPVGAGFSASMANDAAGARSRVAGGVAALAIIAAVATVLPWIARTPEPVLAAIVIHAVSHALDPRGLKPYFVWERDRIVAIVAVVAVIVLGVLDGLLASIAVSVLMMLRALSAPKVSVLGRFENGHDYVDVDKHSEAAAIAGVLILRPEAPLLFANCDRLLAQAALMQSKSSGCEAVILSLEESADLDGSSLEALRDFAALMHTRGVRLLLARVKEPVRALIVAAQLPELPISAVAGWSVADAVKVATSATTLTETTRAPIRAAT